MATTKARLKLAQRLDPGGHIRVSLAGELDIATADEAYVYLREAIRRTEATVEVDATGLSFCGAVGLRVLTRAACDARLERRPLRMTAMPPSLLRMIRITGLHRAYPELVPLRAALLHGFPRERFGTIDPNARPCEQVETCPWGYGWPGPGRSQGESQGSRE
jgi:anti-anti-sigma factor